MQSNHGQDNQDFISEINVTPLVDVMLVLLIIFMISAPLLMNNIALQLPQTKKVQSLSQNKKSIMLSIDSSGKIYLEKQEMTLQKLENYFEKLNKQNSNLIYLRVDQKTNYEYVAKILALLKSLNLNQISLVTEFEKKK
jgi:biopolymer transport protein TolR